MNRLLIDASNMLQTALHRGTDPDAYPSDGCMIKTWEHGYSQFLSYLKSVLTDLEMAPRQIIFCLDAPKSRRRRQRIHPGYKEDRIPQAPDFYKELKLLDANVQQFIKEIGGTVAVANGFEADDLIAHLAKGIPNSVVLSTDKDLIFQNTAHYVKRAKATETDCGEAYLPGLHRKYIPLYRTLVGDPKDFGKGTGAKGFGEKAFLKFWLAGGDAGLDCLISQIEDPEAELPGVLQNSADMIRLTWRMANWLPIPYYRVKWEVGFAAPKDCKTYDEEFDEYYQNTSLALPSNTDLAKIIKEAESAPYISLDIETYVGTESEEWLANIKENFSRPTIVVDVVGSILAGLSITVGANLQHTYYFPTDHLDTENWDSKVLRDFILSLKNDFVAHNASGFELPVLRRNWGEWLPNCHCSLIAASYVDENERKGLKTLSKRILNYDQVSYDEVTQGRKMNELTGEEVLQYGCDDTITAGYLMNHFLTVMQLEGSLQAYLDVEQSSMYMTARPLYFGVKTDLTVLEKLEESDRAVFDVEFRQLENYLIKTKHPSAKCPELKDLKEAEIKAAYFILYGEKFKCQMRILDKVIDALPECGFKDILRKTDNLQEINLWLQNNWGHKASFNIGSPKDVMGLLYDHMNCPIMFRNFATKKMRQKGILEGNPVGDGDALNWAIKYNCTIEEAAALNSLLRCKSYLTRKGLYYSSYKHLVHWSDGKLHPNLKQSATTSRRYAPSGPNVNQQPKRNEEGKKIRQCIVPHHKDALLISPDFTGQELRHSAEATQDENFLACYIGEHTKDLHTLTAFEICQKQGKEFDSYEQMVEILDDPGHLLYKLAKDYRGNKAKATNFLSQYISLGGGQDTLSKKLQVSPRVAQEFLDAKTSAFPRADVWKAEYTEQCRETQMASTRLGAKKHLHSGLIRSGAGAVLRSAVNFHIQSSSAEQTKLVLGNILKAGLLDKYDAEFYYPVHDEILFSVAKQDLPNFCAELQPIMEEQYAGMQVPCKASLAVGENFGQLDEVHWDKVDEYLFDKAVG